ncbi:hypothetical protein Ddye_001927 [Dipteronia dyeriana]|uniref:X8 domain-containing protein n=1 Tax=Dipteronia dyeriana TaxID=168575 RepID=A0AAD9XQT2_9ROSI|nr:hypothetical protein Ddye_001927 [Dipteronia dyeriana]
MAALLLLSLILAMAGHSSATWCVCKEAAGESGMQKALDYACGAGADCGLIHTNGACFNPNTVKAHCNFAVNSYFQKKGQAQGSCDFAGAATISTSDPSTAGCSYPSSTSTAGSTTTTPSTTPVTTSPPTTTTPSTTTPSITTPTAGTTTSPYTTTPSNGVLGGVGTGVGPSGAGINTDYSHGGLRLQNSNYFSLSKILFFSGLMLLWG